MKTENSKRQILIYNYNNGLNKDLFCDLTVVNSPATCLRKATQHMYDLVVISQKVRSLNERFALIELCLKLNKSLYRKHFQLLCLLPFKHRGLLEQLQNAGAEYVRFYDQNDPATKEYIEALLAKPSEDCSVGRILSEICPHINYFPISRHQEILYCGAYRNRLVLGPHRLNNLCETMNHLNCQYFKNPKSFKRTIPWKALGAEVTCLKT